MKIFFGNNIKFRETKFFYNYKTLFLSLIQLVINDRGICRRFVYDFLFIRSAQRQKIYYIVCYDSLLYRCQCTQHSGNWASISRNRGCVVRYHIHCAIHDATPRFAASESLYRRVGIDLCVVFCLCNFHDVHLFDTSRVYAHSASAVMN